MVTVEIPEAPEDVAAETVVTPNVLGLNPADAQAALADAGAIDGIETQDVPTAGEPGFVIGQDPAPGAAISGTVTLLLSAPVDVPGVVGQPFADARTTLERLGAQVRVKTQYQDGTPADQVIAIEPASGALPTEVELVVAAPAAQLSLAQLTPIDESCDQRANFGVAGQVQTERTWACSIQPADRARSISWDLSADVSQVTFVAGVTDDSDPVSNARVDVLVDGEIVDSKPTTFGVPADFTIPTAGALRLKIRVSTDTPTEQYRDWETSFVAIVDPIVTGSSDALDELAGLNS